jgi:hypothetical protein
MTRNAIRTLIRRRAAERAAEYRRQANTAWRAVHMHEYATPSREIAIHRAEVLTYLAAVCDALSVGNRDQAREDARMIRWHLAQIARLTPLRLVEAA